LKQKKLFFIILYFFTRIHFKKIHQTLPKNHPKHFNKV
jgi:hypothetical protein